MATLRAAIVGGGTIEFDDKPIGRGGEKVVFMSTNKQQVVCFFYNTLSDRSERRKRLDNIIGKHNVTQQDFWKGHYCWPTGLVDGDPGLPKAFLHQHRIIEPPLAVIAPAYKKNFFFRDRTGKIREKNGLWFTGEKARKLLPVEEAGNFLTYLQVCTKMARAVRKMHYAGLAHSDLSNKNVLIDPRNGDSCIIDCDSLVVRGIAPPAVMGTPGYIAPEVLAGTSQPCIETDRHALGVLIYQTLLLRHPLIGPKINSRASAEEDELWSMGLKALYIEHPNDRTNALRPPPVMPVGRLGPHLSEVFNRTFVGGLHAPLQRPTADDYERGLYRTFDILHPTPDGGDWFILAPGMPLQCPLTRRKLTAPVPYAHYYSERKPGQFSGDGRGLTIYHNLGLMNWHTQAKISPDENGDRRRQGFFSFYQGRWLLVNESAETFQVVRGASVAPGQMLEITPGLEVRVSSKPNGRVLRFEFMKP